MNQSGKNDSSEKKRDKQIVLNKFISLVLLFLVFIGGALFLLSPYGHVAVLSVSGSNEVHDQEIIESSRIQSGDPLLRTFINRREIEEEIISGLPQISDATLSFSGINDVTFEVEEYQTAAYILEESGYVKVLENGEVLEDEHVTSIGNQPVFVDFEEGRTLNRMISEFQELDTVVYELVSEVQHIPSEHNPLLLRAYMNNGNQVIASLPTFAERMQYYPQMVQAVEGQRGVFDLEAGAFFSPFMDNDPDTQETDEAGEVNLEDVEE